MLALIIGAIISIAGNIVNAYSLAFGYVVFLPIVRLYHDEYEFFKQDIGFIIGVALISGPFFQDYWLTSAALIGMGLTMLRNYYDS